SIQNVDGVLARVLQRFTFRDIARDGGRADDDAVCMAQRRNRNRNIYPRSILAYAQRIIMLDALAAPKTFHNRMKLVKTFRRKKNGDRLPDDFLRRISV